MTRIDRTLKFHRLPLILMAAFLVVTSANCSIRLISDYDETIDKSVTQLQRKVESFLTEVQRKAGTDEVAYSRHVRFYDEARVDLSAILVRAQAIPKNEITVGQILLVQKSLDTLEKLDKLGFKDQEEIEPLRNAFNTSFSAILRLELAKRRGEKD